MRYLLAVFLVVAVLLPSLVQAQVPARYELLDTDEADSSLNYDVPLPDSSLADSALADPSIDQENGVSIFWLIVGLLGCLIFFLGFLIHIFASPHSPWEGGGLVILVIGIILVIITLVSGGGNDQEVSSQGGADSTAVADSLAVADSASHDTLIVTLPEQAKVDTQVVVTESDMEFLVENNWLVSVFTDTTEQYAGEDFGPAKFTTGLPDWETVYFERQRYLNRFHQLVDRDWPMGPFWWQAQIKVDYQAVSERGDDLVFRLDYPWTQFQDDFEMIVEKDSDGNTVLRLNPETHYHPPRFGTALWLLLVVVAAVVSLLALLGIYKVLGKLVTVFGNWLSGGQGSSPMVRKVSWFLVIGSICIIYAVLQTIF